MKFSVRARRTVIQTIDFEIEADSEDDAWDKADDEAAKQDFDKGEEDTCEIEVTDVEPD